MYILAKRWPDSKVIKNGYVSRFCVFLIDQATILQPNWDFQRFQERTDDKGNPVWRESVPPGLKIRRINFKLAFGLYRVLNLIQPNSPETIAAKGKLEKMLNTPLSLLWVDEKAPPTKFGHAGDYMTHFSKVEKKDFSKVICERMFYDFISEKLYLFLKMHADIRNEKVRYVACTKQFDEAAPGSGPLPASILGPQAAEDPQFVLTLSSLLKASGYDPYTDSYTNVIESSPNDLAL
jgi:hypothetical protein